MTQAKLEVAKELIEAWKRRGFTVQTDGRMIRIDGPGKLTQEDKRLFAEHAFAIKMFLHATATHCLLCGQTLDSDGGCRLCFTRPCRVCGRQTHSPDATRCSWCVHRGFES